MRPSPNGANGSRDPSGRFKPGHPGGPGNPYARRVAALRSALLEALTVEDMREVARGLLDGAKRGDAACARLLLSYAIGRPAEAADPDRLEADEFAKLSERPTAFDREILADRQAV